MRECDILARDFKDFHMNGKYIIYECKDRFDFSWISTEEALPELNKEVFVVTSFGVTTSSRFPTGEWTEDEVLFWMPIPPIPEPKTKECDTCEGSKDDQR